MDRRLRASSGNRRVVALQHARSENLGTIEDALTADGESFDNVRTFEGKSIPDDVDRSSGLIIMGGPMGVCETERFPFLLQEMKLIEAFLEARRPILGVCLGCQLHAVAFGAMVRRGRKKEIGWFPVQLSPGSEQDSLWSGQPARFVAYHRHGEIFDLPNKAISLASSETTTVQSFRFGDRAYGIFFHLEVTVHHFHRMLEEFAGEVQQENLDPDGILKQGESFLPTLQQIGSTVFRRCVELL